MYKISTKSFFVSIAVINEIIAFPNFNFDKYFKRLLSISSLFGNLFVDVSVILTH